MYRADILGYNKELIKNKRTSAVIGILFFILATALGAYVRIPIKGSPVPITLQTFFVILAGAVLGRRLSIYSQLGYVLLGGLGLPLFQGQAFGISSLLGPTGGYLIGFVFCAWFVGHTTQARDNSLSRIIAIFAIGSLIIYAFGISWLISLYRFDPIKAVILGALPFVPGDTVKVLIAAAIYHRISHRAKNIFFI